jgi:hypothetical protein
MDAGRAWPASASAASEVESETETENESQKARPSSQQSRKVAHGQAPRFSLLAAFVVPTVISGGVETRK